MTDEDSAFDVANNQPSASVAQPHKRVKRGTVNILDDKLAVSLDMAKVSDRNAALLLTPAVQRLGHDTAEFNLNRSSIENESKGDRKLQKISRRNSHQLCP